MKIYLLISLPSIAVFLRRMGVAILFSACPGMLLAGVAMFFLCGCEQQYSPAPRPEKEAITEFETLNDYQPVKAVFLPLSDVRSSDKAADPDTITVYIALQDGAGSSVKAPVVFRFELYQFSPLSADPKGKRLYIWEDINLNTFKENNRYWRDYLRAYEFRLLYNCPDCRKYVLEVTCMNPSGTRLLADIILTKK
jgi:hypothetical protein